MPDNYCTIAALKQALDEYDDDTPLELDADGVRLNNVRFYEDDGALVFY